MRSTGFARVVLAFVLAAAVIVGLGGRPPEAQTPDRVPPALLARVADGDSIRVIVGVDAPQADIRRVDGASAVRGRQQAMRAALDGFLDAATANGVEVVQRYANFPFVSARVDRPALEWLAAHPLVTSVRAPAVGRPLLAASVPLINAPQAWAAGATGAGWYVAVVDTGVAKTHPFLSGKVAIEGCPSGGVLDASDPDAHTKGVSLCPLMPQANIPPVRINRWWGVGSGVPCTGYTDCSHGTHVAGIAVGGTGNAGGVSGVAPGAGLMAVMVMRLGISAAMCGGPAPCVIFEEESLLESFDHVFTEHFLSLNEHVAAINLSLGAENYSSTAACDAAYPSTTYAINSLRAMGGEPSLGIATVVASGNDGSLAGVSWPACISGAISVGSTTKSDLISDFTNRLPFLSLLAPGSNIISSVPAGPDTAMSGTSMAAPHVAGAWAVLKQAKPEATVTEILNALRTTGVPINDPVAIPAAPYRRIDLNAARLALVSAGPAAPAPPISVNATVNGLTAALSWSPGVGGGLPTHYLVVAGTTPGGSQVGLFNVGLTTSVAGALAPGTYYVRVIAANAAGQSAPSAEVTISVGGLPAIPGPPAGVTVTVNGNTVTFVWNAPTTGGTVGSYLLMASLTPGGPAIATLPVSGTGISVSNVPPGTYYVRVVAVNAGGPSGASNEVTVSVAAPQAPGSPTMNPPSVSGSTVDLSWTPASTGGPVTQFLVSASVTPGGPIVAVLPTTATSVSVPGVGFGSYYVSVTAMNSFGSSSASNVVTVVVGATVPTLTFTAPATLTAPVGVLYRYPFCAPDPGGGLCMAGSTNPTGGTPPYHFQLDTLGGFPPFGLSLDLNGTLTGTPTTLGDRTFAVCAVDQVGTNVCRTLTMSIVAGAAGTYAGAFKGSFTEHGYFSYWPADCDWNATYTGNISMQVTQNINGTVAGTATITGTVSAPQGVSSSSSFTCLATTFELNDAVAISGTGASVTWTIRPNGLKWVFTGALNGTTITGNMVTNASFASGNGQFTTSGTIPVVVNKQ